MKRIATICLLFASLLLPGCGSRKRYELIGRRGRHTYLVYVPQRYAEDLDAYEQAIHDVASDPQQACIVMFWNDRAKVWRPEQADMTMQQETARVAGYSRDPNRDLNNFYWLRDGARVDVGPIE